MSIDHKTRAELFLMKKTIEAIRENVQLNLNAISAKIDEILPEEEPEVIVKGDPKKFWEKEVASWD